jgi:hypothetical protein
MLSIQEIYELSWLYLLFRILDPDIRYNSLTRTHLDGLVWQRLGGSNFVPEAKLRVFAVDLSLAANAKPHPFRLTCYTLSKEDRALIAYHFNLVSLRNESWWKEGIDKVTVREFALIANISQAESKEFFEHIVAVLKDGYEMPELKAVS